VIEIMLTIPAADKMAKAYVMIDMSQTPGE